MIGIVTINAGTNYGNRLQNYAVQQILKNMGFDVQTVFYKTKFINKIKMVVKIALGRGSLDSLRRRRMKKFELFNKRNIKMVFAEKDTLNQLNDGFDCVICGSDQIWNFNFSFTVDNAELFFAKFVSPEKRIAFSASIGSENIPKNYARIFAEGINGFREISVREERGRDIIKELTGRDVSVTMDPTMILNKSEWRKIEKKPRFLKKDESYILTYFLGERDEQVVAYTEEVASANGLKVIDLYTEFYDTQKVRDKFWFTADPSEFIWLISNCELVMTDSFHGCIFSMIMDKPFRCFKRQDSAEDMSSRMDTLFKKFNVSDWCIGDINEDVEHVFYKDYSDFESTLKKEQDFAYDYLKGALDIK